MVDVEKLLNKLVGIDENSFDSYLANNTKYTQEDRELIIDALYEYLEITFN